MWHVWFRVQIPRIDTFEYYPSMQIILPPWVNLEMGMYQHFRQQDLCGVIININSSLLFSLQMTRRTRRINSTSSTSSSTSTTSCTSSRYEFPKRYEEGVFSMKRKCRRNAVYDVQGVSLWMRVMFRFPAFSYFTRINLSSCIN